MDEVIEETEIFELIRPVKSKSKSKNKTIKQRANKIT